MVIMVKLIEISIVIILMSLFCIIGWKKNFSIEKKFLILFLVTGMFYMILLPYLRVPDEQEHFCRAFKIFHQRSFTHPKIGAQITDGKIAKKM